MRNGDRNPRRRSCAETCFSVEQAGKVAATAAKAPEVKRKGEGEGRIGEKVFGRGACVYEGSKGQRSFLWQLVLAFVATVFAVCASGRLREVVGIGE